MDGRPPAELAVDHQPAAVPLDDMLYDRETEAGAAEGAAAARIDPVEALGHALDMFGRDPLALVCDGKVDHWSFGVGGDRDRRAGLAVAKRVGDEIVEQLE